MSDSDKTQIDEINSSPSFPIPENNKLINLFQADKKTILKRDLPADKTVTTISKIQYQPLSTGERFIFTTDGEFKPEIQNIEYPSRLSLKAAKTAVILPVEAEDKYQIEIDGAMSTLMKVFQRQIDNTFESSILFYYKIPKNEQIQYSFYPTDKANVYNLDLLPFAVVSNEHVSVEESKVLELTNQPIEPLVIVEAGSDVVAIPVVDENVKEPLVTFIIAQEPENNKSPMPVEIAKDEFDVRKIPAEEKKSEDSTVLKPDSLPSVSMSIKREDGLDKFVFKSEKPLSQYKYSVLNNPSRLVLEFPDRDIKFDSAQFIPFRYIDGNATELIRISDDDVTGSWSRVHIYLKYQWDKLECSLSRGIDSVENENGSELSFTIDLKKMD
ncbi:hypothetical protein KKB99_04755 [bacterium]|nr:hypothetical protein [bacterium]MBU1025306.1 hypothetical protein [bacterium]